MIAMGCENDSVRDRLAAGRQSRCSSALGSHIVQIEAGTDDLRMIRYSLRVQLITRASQKVRGDLGRESKQV